MHQQDIQPIDNPTAVKIIDAASHLFLQRGYKAVSISEIIKAAGVTKPTLYYYFADKEELFVQMGLRVLAQMGGQLRSAITSAHATHDRLLAIARAMLADPDRDMAMIRHEMFEHLGPAQRERLAAAFYAQLHAPLYAVMAEGIARGELVRYPASALTMLFMGLSGPFQEYAADTKAGDRANETGGLYDAVKLDATVMVDLFLHGVAPHSNPDLSEGQAHRKPQNPDR